MYYRFKTLRRLNEKVKNVRGCHSDIGETNQEALFKFYNYISSSPLLSELLTNIQKAVNIIVCKEIGCVHTVNGVGFAGNIDIAMEKIYVEGLKNGFQLCVFPQSLNIKVTAKRELF